MSRTCCILNIAPVYRRAIFALLDNDPTMEVDFLFGEESIGGIAVMNGRTLKGFRGYLHNIYNKSGKLIWQRKAIRMALSRRYDTYILTGNAGIRSNWIIVLIARLLGRKIVLWSHGLYGGEGKGERLKNMTYMRMAGHLLLYGDRAAKLVTESGFDPSKIKVVYNSLDYDTQLELRGRVGDKSFIRNYFGNDLPSIAFVGRLTQIKRIDMIIEALDQLGANLILVGDGPLRVELEEMAQDRGLADRVWFYGECYDQSMIATILYHSSVVLSPGNVGLTAIHALSVGTPVVTHDHSQSQMPEAEAVIPDVTGALFERDNLADMVRVTKPWLTANFDEREATREACYGVIDSKYNPYKQIETIRQVVHGAK